MWPGRRSHRRRASDREESSTRIVVEPDLLRTAVLTIMLGSLAAMLAYFAICAAAGEGRGIFQVTATVAVLLALGAAINRRRTWLRFLLFLWALGACAMLVDQLAYYRWHRQVDGFVGRLERGVTSGSPALSEPLPLQPTLIQIDRNRDVVLTFEPPLLAWTYRADATSPAAHRLIAGWYGALARLVQNGSPDRVARAIVTPHTAYTVSVASQTAGDWVVSIDPKRRDQVL